MGRCSIWVSGCRWVGVGVGGVTPGVSQITNNQINHNLIKIIQLSLTIFDLWSHSHLWVVGWMDILDIFLKPPNQYGQFLFSGGWVG